MTAHLVAQSSTVAPVDSFRVTFLFDQLCGAAYALELLAWDLFLGLSLLFAAPVFKGGKLEDAVRTGLNVGGTLCIAGILGPATGEMRLQFIAIVGYAGVLPTVSLLIIMLFRRSR